jgi:hypothetical protein
MHQKLLGVMTEFRCYPSIWHKHVNMNVHVGKHIALHARMLFGDTCTIFQ